MLDEQGAAAPIVVTTSRWAECDLGVTDDRIFAGARPHADIEGVDAAVSFATTRQADLVVAVGGGSTINTGKAVSEKLGIPLICVPTTYSGAEWTPYYGMRDRASGRKLRGADAHTVGILYETGLTVGLGLDLTGGSALNAMAHCVEAQYARSRTQEGASAGLAGAASIARALPDVLADPCDLEPRRRLLEGAAHAGEALAQSGLAISHAMAQALGGLTGLSHGGLHALCLPEAMRFNAPVVPQALADLGTSMAADDAIAIVDELRQQCGFTSLRDLGVPRNSLIEASEVAVGRPGAANNPRPASSADVHQMLSAIW